MRFGCEFAIFGSKDDEAGYWKIDFFHLEELLEKADMLIQLHSRVFHDGFFSSSINAEKFTRLVIKMELAIDVFGLNDDGPPFGQQ